MKAKNLKPKTCKAPGCDNTFAPWVSTQVVCSTHCALEYTKEKMAKKEAKQNLEQKRQFRLNDRAYQLKKAQESFNRYIRVRDHNKPCISCGTTTAGQYHAGHYRTVKAQPAIRFHPMNCHKQCAQCNNFDSGNLVNYRIELASRIGASNLEWLEKDHPSQKLTVEEIREITAFYKEQAKLLTGSKV